MKLVSWNVNGIRAIERKNEFELFDADILCIQETKSHKEQLTEKLVNIDGYNSFFVSAERKGYSGVALYTKVNPVKVEQGFDNEGRIIRAEYENFVLFNVYFPNGKSRQERLDYKMNFYKTFQELVLKEYKPVIVCGDVNTAHKGIDLARPDANSDKSGFLPIEREWIDSFLNRGFSDALRLFHKEAHIYSWWDYKTRARKRNVGWRIDYFFVQNSIKDKVKDCYILNQKMGSDHAPVVLEIEGL
ncbi:MAG: exodeoxyribonuclease III [Candidatus Muiribacteriota bacterium]